MYTYLNKYFISANESLQDMVELLIAKKLNWLCEIRWHAFCMPQVPFAFESERPRGNSETKLSLNYRSSDLEKSVKQPNGNLATVLSLNCHSAIQTRTQTQTEPEVFRKYALTIFLIKRGKQNFNNATNFLIKKRKIAFLFIL